MKCENTTVMNFEGAFRGLRNPLESWKKSDSIFGIMPTDDDFEDIEFVVDDWLEYDNALRIKTHQPLIEEDSVEEEQLRNKFLDWLYKQGTVNYDPKNYSAEVAFLGPNDLNLAQRMIKAGSSDRKFLRQILVSVDIKAPLYWWKEFDTYKVGTTANSTSTMHKLASTPITIDCFELEDFSEEGNDFLVYNKHPNSPDMFLSEYWQMLVNDLEHLRFLYNQTKDQRYWKALIQFLPSAWLQTRTVTLNYEILRNIYIQRRNHRLVEWHDFCRWIQSLPYAKELITYWID